MTLAGVRPFAPPGWLRDAHLQSMLPSLPGRRWLVERRAAPVIAASRELLLDCGDDVVLQAFHAPCGNRGTRDRRIAVLLHGWEGSADSLYVLSLAQTLYDDGFDIVRLNLRDHGATHHLNRELFHSCRLPEVSGALRALQARFGGEPLNLVGFSLGGNFLLRVVADAAADGLELAHVVAVSPVLDPAHTLARLEAGVGLYHQYFVRKWARSLVLKQAAWPQDYDFGDLLRTRSLRKMTADLVRQFTPFAGLDAYLDGYSLVGERLATIAAPTTLITAADDPLIPALDLEHIARPAPLRLIVSPYGGHCGFLERLGRTSWMDHAVSVILR